MKHEFCSGWPKAGKLSKIHVRCGKRTCRIPIGGSGRKQRYKRGWFMNRKRVVCSAVVPHDTEVAGVAWML